MILEEWGYSKIFRVQESMLLFTLCRFFVLCILCGDTHETIYMKDNFERETFMHGRIGLEERVFAEAPFVKRKISFARRFSSNFGTESNTAQSYLILGFLTMMMMMMVMGRGGKRLSVSICFGLR